MPSKDTKRELKEIANQKLFLGVRKNNKALVDQAIKEGANIDALHPNPHFKTKGTIDEEGFHGAVFDTALTAAIEFGYDDLAKHLVKKHGANVNKPCIRSDTHNDRWAGDEDPEFQEYGPLFGKKYSPMVIAAKKAKPEMAEFLIEHKAQINGKGLEAVVLEKSHLAGVSEKRKIETDRRAIQGFDASQLCCVINLYEDLFEPNKPKQLGSILRTLVKHNVHIEQNDKELSALLQFAFGASRKEHAKFLDDPDGKTTFASMLLEALLKQAKKTGKPIDLNPDISGCLEYLQDCKNIHKERRGSKTEKSEFLHDCELAKQLMAAQKAMGLPIKTNQNFASYKSWLMSDSPAANPYEVALKEVYALAFAEQLAKAEDKLAGTYVKRLNELSGTRDKILSGLHRIEQKKQI